jgi:branched-chain amino acid aminotransferase
VAEAKGFSQVLWLDGVEQKYIEEVGAMNVMFKISGKIVTPSLAKGTVLPGITRKSVLEVLKDWGYEIEERDLSVDELIAAAEDGSLEEAWGTGTAAVISPIGQIIYQDKEHTINNFEIGALTQKLYDTVTGIQWGKQADPYGWVVPVC